MEEENWESMSNAFALVSASLLFLILIAIASPLAAMMCGLFLLVVPVLFILTAFFMLESTR